MAIRSGLMNSTLVTLATSVYLNTTLLPTQSTAIPFNGSTWQNSKNYSVPAAQNSSVNWNYTNLEPNCLNCYPDHTTTSPLVIRYTYSYTYDYAYYAFLLILLSAALVCIKFGISRRKELERHAAVQRRRAHQQAQSSSASVPTANDDNNSNISNNPSIIAKGFDLPPAYEEVVQCSILNNQSASNSIPTHGPIGITTTSTTNTISAAVSTLTIESEISNRIRPT